VQLQLLTATVKLFLKKGSGAQDLVQRLLKTATSECDNPDIRDRAYVYWRLLSASGQVAKSVVLAEKPPINANQQVLSQRLLDELWRVCITNPKILLLEKEDLEQMQFNEEQ
jgi:vesicle coat complex subunit